MPARLSYRTRPGPRAALAICGTASNAASLRATRYRNVPGPGLVRAVRGFGIPHADAFRIDHRDTYECVRCRAVLRQEDPQGGSPRQDCRWETRIPPCAESAR